MVGLEGVERGESRKRGERRKRRERGERTIYIVSRENRAYGIGERSTFL